MLSLYHEFLVRLGIPLFITGFSSLLHAIWHGDSRNLDQVGRQHMTKHFCLCILMFAVPTQYPIFMVYNGVRWC